MMNISKLPSKTIWIRLGVLLSMTNIQRICRLEFLQTYTTFYISTMQDNKNCLLQVEKRIFHCHIVDKLIYIRLNNSTINGWFQHFTGSYVNTVNTLILHLHVSLYNCKCKALDPKLHARKSRLVGRQVSKTYTVVMSLKHPTSGVCITAVITAPLLLVKHLQHANHSPSFYSVWSNSVRPFRAKQDNSFAPWIFTLYSTNESAIEF